VIVPVARSFAREAPATTAAAFDMPRVTMPGPPSPLRLAPETGLTATAGWTALTTGAALILGVEDEVRMTPTGAAEARTSAVAEPPRTMVPPRLTVIPRAALSAAAERPNDRGAAAAPAALDAPVAPRDGTTTLRDPKLRALSARD